MSTEIFKSVEETLLTFFGLLFVWHFFLSFTEIESEIVFADLLELKC
jgi:hypothetical protein